MSDSTVQLLTPRLLLRPLEASDAPRHSELASDREVSRYFTGMPHPYPLEAAEAFIRERQDKLAREELFSFAVTLRDSGLFIGLADLAVSRHHGHAELGYWLGRAYWRQGYAPEAARRVLQFGFGELGLNSIHASCITENVASARVMQKIGMRFVGTMRRLVTHGGVASDVHYYDILPADLPF